MLCSALLTDQELKRISGDTFVPERILDFGCGPGTAGLAASAVWPAQPGGNSNDSAERRIRKYTGVDMSRSMLDAALIMTKGRIADAAFLSKISEVTKLATEGSASVDAQAGNGRYDLAVLSYTLSEMTSDPARRAAVQVLFELLDVNGYLVIIEPGNPYGSHTVRTGESYSAVNR